jgi:ribosomal protein S18 acetylase RimI-like enzyme
MTAIKPEELKNLQQNIEENSLIDYAKLSDSSLKNINEFQKLFPKLKREVIIRKLKNTLAEKNMRFIAKKNNIIIGQLKIVFLQNHQEHVAQLKGLFVLPDERKQGIGLGLVEYTISRLPKKIKLIIISIDNKNKGTIKLYKKLGFEKYGLLENASKIDGFLVDNYLMKKEIN